MYGLVTFIYDFVNYWF